MINFIYFILLQNIFISCKTINLGSKEITPNLKVYFVPNRFSTYNFSTSTFDQEYKEFGLYFKILDAKKLQEFRKRISTLKPARGGRNGKRIKVVYNSADKNDTIYMSYLCNSSTILNRTGVRTNPYFSKFILKLIEENYVLGKISYKGTYYIKNKDDMKENIIFIQDRINGCKKPKSNRK